MMTDEPTTFIACLDCRVLEPDAAPGLAASNQPRLVDNKRTADGFLRAHSCHHTTRLERRDLDLSSEQRLWHPRSDDSFAASDGERLYVVTGMPEGRDVRYELRPGTLHAKESALAVDEETIRRGLVSALFPYRLRPTKFRRFMSALHAIIRDVSVQQLDLVFEAADDLSIGIARMPDDAYAELSRQCRTFFDTWELPHIENFLRRDQQQEGLLALRVRRELAVLDA